VIPKSPRYYNIDFRGKKFKLNGIIKGDGKDSGIIINSEAVIINEDSISSTEGRIIQ
jgi:hypothetical protein